MKIDDKTLEKYRKICFEEFKEKISKKEALEQFSRLVNLLRVIVRPSDKKDDPDQKFRR